MHDLARDAAPARRLRGAACKARPQRAMIIRAAGFDWNCLQHISMRIAVEDVQRAIDERDARIAALEQQLKAKSNVAATALS